MKRNGTQNIIFDDDITMSDNINAGRKLSDIIKEQSSKIKGLESNVKWLYKYGGVGSGSGGGGNATSWTAVVTRVDNGKTLKDETQEIFGKKGNYYIKTQIYNGGISTFKVTYSYVNSRGPQQPSGYMTPTNGFSFQRLLELDQNGTLSITIINQDTQEVASYTIPYIVSAYDFSIKYVYCDDDKPVSISNHTIFMNDVKEKGIKVLFNSNVSIGIQHASYTYTDWLGETHTISSNDEEKAIEPKKNKMISLDLVPDGPDDSPGEGIKRYLQNNNNSGFKVFSLSVSLTLENNTDEENIPQLTLGDNLIPSDLYLKVLAYGGKIFETEQQDIPDNDKFLKGNVSFNLTVYNGSYDSTKFYSLTVEDKHDDVNTTLTSNYTMKEQSPTNLVVTLTSIGLHEITFNVAGDSSSYRKKYYLEIKDSDSNFTWYSTNNNKPSYSSYYRFAEEVKNFADIQKDELIELSAVSNYATYTFDFERPTNLLDYDQFISVGIQYNEINDTESPIFSIESNNDNRKIEIYQNKISISATSSDAETAEIFVPLSDNFSKDNSNGYHLITIYNRFQHYDDGNYYTSINVYIDGVLDGAFSNFSTHKTDYDKIIFKNCNVFCNLVEYSLFSHTKDDNDDYYSHPEDRKFLNDNDILYYYYTYKSKILNLQISENEFESYNFFSRLHEDSDGFIIADATTIENIASVTDIPILQINATDNGTGYGIYTNYDNDNFKDWITNTDYQENDVIPKYGVTLDWKGNNDDTLETIMDSGGAGAAIFDITLQGSSTLTYRCKNFELYAPKSSDSEKDCIFSPNFSDNDTTSFLPESSFTLKADVVDSSHTNNNAMGLFVNSITTPFQKARQINSYSDYIKNCLTGFPFLLFLHTAYKSNAASDINRNNYYFLGIYNFNLGRNSYYNLGYKDLSILEDNVTLRNGFNIYEIPRLNNTISAGVVVGEIQGNSNYFDFSQYDDTVLFSNSDTDKQYMFGDIVYGRNNNEESAKTKIKEFVSKVCKAGGFIFNAIGKHFSDEISDNYGYLDGYSSVDNNQTPKNQVPNYRFQLKRVYDGNEWKYILKDEIQEAEQADFEKLVILNEEEHQYPSLDYNSLSEYYTVCMAFGLVDSVQKNLNIKSWNVNEENPLFYIAFYDMDTCLGISNSGNRIDYFAFSDYWKSVVEDKTLKSVTIYRDFAPKSSSDGGSDGGNFYDIPSSYLFAIAKYGYNVAVGNASYDSDNQLYKNPSNLWALWRQSAISPSNPTAGCLKDANTFMENYFLKHLQDVPYSAFNLNYRYKYFFDDPSHTAYFNYDFSKFHGRKLAYTKQWLEGRFHILDAYFNINSINDILYNNIKAPYPDGILVDNNNKDIYVLNDIFSAGNVSQYSNANETIQVTSQSYSPLIINKANAYERFLFPKEVGNGYKIQFVTSGSQTVTFGGSSLWTDIDKIDAFIKRDGSFYVNSKYLKNIYGNSNRACSSWIISLPSITNLTLNGENFSGQISFNGAEKYPNLQNINISRTNINLFVDGCNISTLFAENMKPASSIQILNVQTLTDVRISGNMNTLAIPAWSENIKFPLSNEQSFNCSSINITNNKFDNCSLTIENNNTLETITVQGVTSLTIKNCPKLKDITINDNNKLTSIEVYKDKNEEGSGSLKIGNVSNVVDLTNQSVLNSVKFNNCEMEKIIMPNHNINLPKEAFMGCSQLKYFDGNARYFLTSTGTFSDCDNFALKKNDNDNDISPIYVSNNATNISNTFYISNSQKRGSINFDAASSFLSNHCEDADNVKNINNLFYNQNIEYNSDNLINEYNRHICSLSLSNFTSVTNAEGVFYLNKISGYNRYMFKDLGKDSASFAMMNIIGETTSRDPNVDNNERYKTLNSTNYHILYVTTDFLYEIINKLSRFDLNTAVDNDSYLWFVNSDKNFITDIELGNDVFCNHEGENSVYPVKLTNLNYFEIFPGHNLSLENMFSSDWINAVNNGLTSSTFLFAASSNYTHVTGYGELLKYVKINSITRFLRLSSNSSQGTPIDMIDFINWEHGLGNNTTNLFFDDNGYASLTFYKQITYADFQRVWSYILNTTKLASIGCLFSNCIILSDSDIQEFLLTNNTDVSENFKIAKTLRLFENCHISNSISNTTYFPMRVTHNFLNNLPKLTEVRYMFYNTYWGNPIPFDFFHKRFEKSQTVYVENDGNMTEATYYTYDYTREMTDLRYCFRNITFEDEQNTTFKQDGIYNKNSFLKNRVVDNNGVEYNYYYATNNADTPISVESQQNTEILDAISAENEDISYVQSVVFNNYNITNFNAGVVNGKSGCFVTPDIFYAVNTSAYITNSLGVGSSSQNSTSNRMSGLIPPSLLKNAKTLLITGIFTNLNIIPWYIFDTVENETTYKNYCYVPSNFTNSLNLSEVFNFHLILPNNNTSEITRFFVLQKDSIQSNITSLSDGLPGVTTDNYRSGFIGNAAGYPNTTSYSSNVNYNIMAEFKVEDGNNTVIEGIDMTYFNKLKLDNLVNPILAMFLSGNLFTNNFGNNSTWKTTYLANRTNTYVISIGAQAGHYGGLSRMARINLPTNNNRFLTSNLGSSSSTYVIISRTSVLNTYEVDENAYSNINFVS